MDIERHQSTTRQRKKEKRSVLDTNEQAESESGDYGGKARCNWRETSRDLNNTPKFIVVAVFISLSLLFVKHMDNLLPKPLYEEDDWNHPNEFIEERARNDLRLLTNVGPRVSGSRATDIEEVSIFISILYDIRQKKSEQYSLEYEESTPSGVFYMDDDEGHTSSYSKIANVVAKLEPVDAKWRSNNSILFNCHFDTKVGSPGATDNVISCATMLEILRVLSRHDSVIKNTLIFLFNGAEEYGLQGAHGFIGGKDGSDSTEGHKWSKTLKGFVNLEGAGAGGGEILFQSGPGDGWILNSYSKHVPHPYGLCIAEEAFQRNFIPSDTDFRIFRDFAGIPGLDMAFIKNGWVYHTKWDRLSEIPPGSIQHMGDNAFALAEHFGNLDFNKVQSSEQKMVFFDLFGVFMISYTETVGIIINFLMGMIGVCLAVLEVFLFEKWIEHKGGFNVDKNQSKFRYYGRKTLILIWMLLSTVVAWLAGALMAFLVGLIFNSAGYFKPFYSYPSLSLVIFGVPAILAQIIVYAFAHKGSTDRSWIAAKFTLSMLILPGTFITRIVYVLSINLLFGFLGFYLARLGVLYSPFPKKNIQKLIIYLLIGELIPFTIACYLVVTLIDVFVPIMGRSGSETNANVYIGLIVSSIVSIIGFSGLVSVFVSFKKRLLITALVFSMFVINPLIVFGFIGKIPYQEKTPMRLNIVNVDRIWYNSGSTTSIQKSDSAYWFWQVDSNTMDMMSIFAKTVNEIEEVQEVNANSGHCEDLYCALPFMWPVTDQIKKTPMIFVNQNLPAKVRDSVNMTVVENIPVSPTKRRLTLNFVGPSQTTVVLSPGENHILTNWSLTCTVPHSGLKWKGRDTYFVYHGKGFNGDNLNITLELEQLNGRSGSSSLLNVNLCGHFLHGEERMTRTFQEFAEKFPFWTYVMNWSSVLKMYTVD